MNKRSFWALYLSFMFAVLNAWAETPTAAPTNENTVKIQDVTGQKNKVEGDLDTEITNPKIRADSGSKSKFSMSTTMSYKGGAISRPFGVERPNLAGVPENQVDSSIDGSLKVRYRPSTHSSFTLGVGMGLKTPFQGDVNHDNSQVNIGDPLVGYNYTFAAGGLQHSMNLTGSAGTSQESLHVDQDASAAVDYTLMKAFQNGVHLGFSTSAWNNFYNTAPGKNTATMIRSSDHQVDSRTAWAMSFFPTLEYYLSDKVAVRTLFGYFRWRHLYGDSKTWSMTRMKEYHSVGLGLTVARDVYVYPNVQFLPLDIRSKYTNFGISTTINVF